MALFNLEKRKIQSIKVLGAGCLVSRMKGEACE